MSIRRIKNESSIADKVNEVVVNTMDNLKDGFDYLTNNGSDIARTALKGVLYALPTAVTATALLYMNPLLKVTTVDEDGKLGYEWQANDALKRGNYEKKHPFDLVDSAIQLPDGNLAIFSDKPHIIGGRNPYEPAGLSSFVGMYDPNGKKIEVGSEAFKSIATGDFVPLYLQRIEDLAMDQKIADAVFKVKNNVDYGKGITDFYKN